jgi:hypothetical protein
LDQVGRAGALPGSREAPLATFQPFADLASLLKNKK